MQIVDLSYEIYHGMPKYWADYHPNVEIEITGTYKKNGWLVRKLVIGTHSGTHIDAPAHFTPEGSTIDQIPLSMLICDAVVLDFTHKKPKEETTIDEVKDIDLKPGEGVLIAFGWDKHWGVDFYENFPTLAPEAAMFLIAKGMACLGTDIPLTHEVHKIVLGAGKILLDNLTNLTNLNVSRVKLIALPLKIRGGDAAPARVVAIID